MPGKYFWNNNTLGRDIYLKSKWLSSKNFSPKFVYAICKIKWSHIPQTDVASRYWKYIISYGVKKRRRGKNIKTNKINCLERI